jgi:transcriptional regulator with XRE-family HTH domain
MVNSEEFIVRLEKILNYYGVSAAVFADKIGVQRSSISHLLSGRNKPSLEFVMKVVRAFPEVNLYWLLNGKGVFPAKKETPPIPDPKVKVSSADKSATKAIQRIVIFYNDGSFESFDHNKPQKS